MHTSHVILLEREPIIARDMGEEVLALDPHAVVRLARSVERALIHADALGRVDLLIVSHRSEPLGDVSRMPELAQAARSVLLVGDDDPDWLRAQRDVHVARTPFTSWSLRQDLCRVTVSGAPLFPQIPRESVRSQARPG